MTTTLDTLPDANRYIPVSLALIDRWCGPVHLSMRLFASDLWSWTESTTGCGGIANGADPRHVRLDPMRPEVRDHLIRALSLPQWMRDTPGGLEPWQSAGLIACASAGVEPRALLAEYDDLGRSDLRGTYAVRVSVPFPEMDIPGGWWFTMMGTRLHGPEAGDPGKIAADLAALAHGCALMLSPDAMALPFPEWRAGLEAGMTRADLGARVVQMLMDRTGVSLWTAVRAVEAVGPDYYRAVEWIRANTRVGA